MSFLKSGKKISYLTETVDKLKQYRCKNVCARMNMALFSAADPIILTSRTIIELQSSRPTTAGNT